MLPAEDLGAVITAQGGAGVSQTQREQTEQPGIGQEGCQRRASDEDQRACPEQILIQSEGDQQRDDEAAEQGNRHVDARALRAQVAGLQLLHEAVHVRGGPYQTAAALGDVLDLGDAGSGLLFPKLAHCQRQSHVAVIFSPQGDHQQQSDHNGELRTELIRRTEGVQRGEEGGGDQEQVGAVLLSEQTARRLAVEPVVRREHCDQQSEQQIDCGAAGEDIRQEPPVQTQIEREEQTEQGE